MKKTKTVRGHVPILTCTWPALCSLGSCSCSLTSTLENLRQWHCHQWISVQTSTASQERSGRFDGAKWDFIHDRLWLFQMLRLWRSELVPDSVSSKVQLHSKVHGSTCERRLLNDYSPSRTIFFLSTLGRLWPLTETKLDFEMSPRTASNDDVSFSNWTGVMQVTVTCWMGLWNASSAHIKKVKRSGHRDPWWLLPELYVDSQWKWHENTSEKLSRIQCAKLSSEGGMKRVSS